MAAEGRLGEEQARREVAIPQGVREVVGRRLDRLSETANEVLRLAAVCGREFELEVLERVCDRRPRSRSTAALDEAVGGRLVVESRERPGLYSFAHALVRETLQAEVPAARRAAIHREVAEAIEAVHAGELDRYLGELAHHFLEAAPAGDAERAVDYATRAAAGAGERLAHEDAASLYARALEALELAGSPDRERRLELLLELGAAQTRAGRRRRGAGDARARRRARARARAPERPRPGRARRSACWREAGVVDEPLIELLEEALEAVGRGDCPLRSQLLSGLAQELYWVDAGRSRRRASGSRRWRWRGGSTTRESLALALIRRQFTGARRARGDPSPAARERRAARPREAAAATASSSCARTSTGSATGSSSATSAASTPTSPPSSGSRPSCASRRCLWHVPLLRGMRALIDGRFDDAEALAAEALAGGERAQEPVSAMFHATQDRRSCAACAARPTTSRQLERVARPARRARRALPGDPGLALLAGRDPRRARPRGRGARPCSSRWPRTTSPTCRSTSSG